VAGGVPTACVVASQDEKLRADAQGLFSTERFRIYGSDDIVGVELGGALKNIIAIAAGISDGMGFGANTKAAILTRGLAEMARLGEKMGAKRETFMGLSGIGDLATTCVSQHSRNRWFGEQIGKGRNIAEVESDTSMVIEGVTTARSAFELSRKVGVEMPITEQIYKVIYMGKDPREAVKELMTRSPKSE
jgi:glycerol-3-phosphate dehydrogenase (NAD(P)+)